ncbi:MAG: ABC transporter ATP-binding protein [Desulfobacterales bacterium]|nr:ABC transporter ATP-binding protein [Desulfobacterales bacterium]
MTDRAEEEPAIDIRRLWFSYNGQVVLKDVSLQVARGEFMAMIGPNGGGKTTLLKIMLGLLEPDRGEARVLGLPPKKAAPRIGYVPQDVHINKEFPITALDVVLMGRLWKKKGWGRYSKEDRFKAHQALDQVQMGAFCSRRIGELSGGQRQRVLIARAMVSSPEVLILDEPISSIDTRGQAEFYDLLKALNESVTIVMVSHDMMALHQHVESVACVNRDVHYHGAAEITDEMLDMYECPVEIVAHGVPHRVLKSHK